VKLSVCIITLNEEANIGRTLKSVQPLVSDGQGEIIVVDSGSTDKTVEIAESFGAKVFTEPWKGFAAQKNSAMQKAANDYVLSLDADEEVTPRLIESIKTTNEHAFREMRAFPIARKNFFLGRWIRRGGFYPDAKWRFIDRREGRFQERLVHEDFRLHEPVEPDDGSRRLEGDLLHHAYPTLSGYIEHMNKYSSLGAEMEVEKGRRGFSLINIVIRPWLTFIYNYVFRLGFLDGKEGLLLHMYHAVYVSWKYAKVWELSRASKG